MLIRPAAPSDASLVTRLRLEFLAAEGGVDVSSFDDAFVAQTGRFVARGLADGTLPSWIAEDDGGLAVGIVSMVV
ncbi:MAG: hypothetical protein KDB36_09345, partial [Acidimicrobiales bacterium]|nr:hypothetical protein [Acidimicrobiales bacterium]